MIERFEAFSFAISKISRCWNKIASDEMEKHYLKAPCSLYLLVIYDHQEGITATALSEICNRDKADISRALNVMEKQGLIYKEDVNRNRYRAKLFLTEKGKLAAKSVGQRACLAVDTAGKDVSDEHRKIFYEVLEKIADNLQKICKAGLD